jgi:hypothetical protein
MDGWVGVYAGLSVTSVKDNPGAVFVSPVNGLKGIGVWLDRPPHPSVLTLREVAPDGRSLGREIASVYTSGFEQNGLAAFTFDPIPDSAGKRYAFVLKCPRCSPDERPGLTVMKDRPTTPANAIKGGRLLPRTTAVFTPMFSGGHAAAEPSATTVRATELSAGRWRLQTAGTKPSLVVLADAYFPGWTARVDGKAAKVLKADGAFLGVVVGPGQHVVQLAYHRPASALVGRLITFVTLLLAGAVLWRDRRRARKAPPARASRRRAAQPAARVPEAAPRPSPPGTRRRPRRTTPSGSPGRPTRARRSASGGTRNGDRPEDRPRARGPRP